MEVRAKVIGGVPVAVAAREKRSCIEHASASYLVIYVLCDNCLLDLGLVLQVMIPCQCFENSLLCVESRNFAGVASVISLQQMFVF